MAQSPPGLELWLVPLPFELHAAVLPDESPIHCVKNCPGSTRGFNHRVVHVLLHTTEQVFKDRRHDLCGPVTQFQ